MAFDKQEIKQLKELLFDLESRVDRKFESLEEKMDRKFSVQRLEISKDTKSIVYSELKPIHEKLDRFFKMESEDVGEAYKEIKGIKIRMDRLEMRAGIK